MESQNDTNSWFSGIGNCDIIDLYCYCYQYLDVIKSRHSAYITQSALRLGITLLKIGFNETIIYVFEWSCSAQSVGFFMRYADLYKMIHVGKNKQELLISNLNFRYHKTKTYIYKQLPDTSDWLHVYRNISIIRPEIPANIDYMTFDLPIERCLDINYASRWPTIMMTSSNGNIFRVTDPLCGEFTGSGEFPPNASDAELWCFLWSASE